MGKLSNVPSLRVEDFDSEKSWIGKLFFQLDPFFSSINDLLTGNVSFPDNVRSVSQDYSISSFQAFALAWPFDQDPPVDVRIIKATKGTSATATILLCAWSYNASTKQINISRMTEVLDTSVAALSGSYTFTVRATV